MRKVVAALFMTLDGVVESPEKWQEHFDEDMGEAMMQQLASQDAVLLGRVTYQGFAKAWPSMTDEQGFADRMNSLPKFVVSRTLEKLEWNNSKPIKGNIAEEVSKLKQQPGQDILIAGSVELIHTLMQHDLID